MKTVGLPVYIRRYHESSLKVFVFLSEKILKIVFCLSYIIKWLGWKQYTTAGEIVDLPDLQNLVLNEQEIHTIFVSVHFLLRTCIPCHRLTRSGMCVTIVWETLRKRRKEGLGRTYIITHDESLHHTSKLKVFCYKVYLKCFPINVSHKK